MRRATVHSAKFDQFSLYMSTYVCMYAMVVLLSLEVPTFFNGSEGRCISLVPQISRYKLGFLYLKIQ